MLPCCGIVRQDSPKLDYPEINRKSKTNKNKNRRQSHQIQIKINNHLWSSTFSTLLPLPTHASPRTPPPLQPQQQHSRRRFHASRPRSSSISGLTEQWSATQIYCFKHRNWPYSGDWQQQHQLWRTVSIPSPSINRKRAFFPTQVWLIREAILRTDYQDNQPGN